MGRFEAAHGGTLFIDEIGDFEVALQVKLLRALESRVITPVGGHKEIKVDSRVLAATSRDIREMMSKGQFREDLYYRLNVITIELPPLRQRLDDIPMLVRRFMDRVNEQNGKKITAIQPAVIDALQQYNWPGNVRELLNIIERMMVLSDKTVIGEDDLPAYIRAGGTRHSVGHDGGFNGFSFRRAQHAYADHHIDGAPRMVSANLPSAMSPAMPTASPTLETALSTMTLDDLEAKAIAAALGRFNNNRTRAARALGISVRTLQRKLGSRTPVGAMQIRRLMARIAAAKTPRGSSRAA